MSSEKVENFSLLLSLLDWINLQLAVNPTFRAKVEKRLAELKREEEREKRNKLKTAQQNKLTGPQHENLKSAQHENLKVAQGRKVGHKGRKEASEWARRRILEGARDYLAMKGPN